MVFEDARTPSDPNTLDDWLVEVVEHPIHLLNHLNHLVLDVVHPSHHKFHQLELADSQDIEIVGALGVGLDDGSLYHMERQVVDPFLVVLRDRIDSTDHYKRNK